METKLQKDSVPITPEMIIGAVKRLESKAHKTTLDDIYLQIKYNYPVSNDKTKLVKELELKLKCCVDVGILKRADSKYRLTQEREIPYLSPLERSLFWRVYWSQHRRKQKEKPTERERVKQVKKKCRSHRRERCCIFGTGSDDEDDGDDHYRGHRTNRSSPKTYKLNKAPRRRKVLVPRNVKNRVLRSNRVVNKKTAKKKQKGKKK